MIITLEKLRWSGMFAYGPDNEIDFTKHKLAQLDALNGSGKSTIMLIIQEVLFSKNIKSIKKDDIANRYLPDNKWNATLNFRVDDVPHEISVARKGATSKVILTENGKNISEHKIPDTYKLIMKIINTSMEVLNQMMYQSSRAQLEFLLATDTNRKKFLVQLFNLERYLQIGEVLKLQLTLLDKKYSEMAGEKKAIDDFLTQYVVIPEKKIKKIVPEVNDTLKDEIWRIEKEISSWYETCAAIDRNNLLSKERDELKFSFNLALPDEVQYNQDKEDWMVFTTQSQGLDKELKDLKSRLNSLNTATHCHVCKQPIDNSHTLVIAKEINERISEITIKQQNLIELINDLNKVMKNYLQLKSEYDLNQKKIERFEQLSNLINSTLPTEYPNSANLKSEVFAKKSELGTQVKAQTEATKYNNDIDIFNGKVDILVNQKREFLARQELISSDIMNLQLKIDKLTTLRKGFSPTGIVAFKLENIIKEFENEINDYLIELSDGQFQINFRLEGEKLNIIVFSSGVESPIENVSDGEFGRIQTATLLAIRKLLSKMGGVQINLLFLDEVMGTLDYIAKEKLIEILLNEENTNTFIIAHGYSHPLVPKISIVKEHNIARIV